VNIVQTMRDPNLFGQWFSAPSWHNWRTVLKAAFALPMSHTEKRFFRDVANRDPPSKPVREMWIIVGRRGGKDSVASLIAAHLAAMFDQGHKLRPGERALTQPMYDDNGFDEGARTALLNLLQDRLDENAYDDAIRMLDECCPGLVADSGRRDDQYRKVNVDSRSRYSGSRYRGVARDQPPRFPGQPRTAMDSRFGYGPPMAMDSKSSFFDRFPEAARIKVV
jgi:hypothetical protein